MNAPEPNLPLLRKAVEWAEAEAAKTDGTGLWQQALWAVQTDCGTAYCIAGYVASAAETDLVVHNDKGYLVPHVNGHVRCWDDIAIDHLGIAQDEADLLFAGGNTIADVRRIAEQIAARAGERL